MTKWIKEWPTEPGQYWFWEEEDETGTKRDLSQLYMVEVRRTRNGVAYIVDGHFTHFVHLYQMEKGAKGVWCPVIVPELPHSEGGKS